MLEARRKRLGAAERRQIILRACLDEFASAGFEGASMDRIAAASGVSKPVLYDHFTSKLALYTGAMEHVREQLLTLGRESVRKKHVGVDEVRAAALAFFNFVRNNPTSIRVLLQSPNSSGEAMEASRRVQETATVGIVTLLTSVVTLEPMQLRLAAEYHKAGLHSLAQQLLENPELDPENLAELATALIWLGLSRLDDVAVSPRQTRSKRGKTGLSKANRGLR
jgi:AcrR family transcriptional regulator